MTHFYIRTEWDFVLARVCNINNWEQTTRPCWQTENGRWHLLDQEELGFLQNTLRALSEMARGVERQWILEANVFAFIKNILGWPSCEYKHKLVMLFAWQLLLDIIYKSSDQSLIWNEFNEILMKHLPKTVYDNDLCRHIVLNIYTKSRIIQHEGMSILKILLKDFHDEKQNGPLQQQQGLTYFLEHFTTDEKRISSMYQNLSDVEKSTFHHFIVDRISNPPVDAIKGYRISSALLDCICNDFISKHGLISPSFVPDHSNVMEIFGLFEVIAHASTVKRHQMNKFDFSLMLNVVHLFNYVRSNDDMAESLFAEIRRNSTLPLKELILSTITNLVKDNTEHKEMAREAGLIEILVNFASAERCPHLYKCMMYTLIDMCRTSPLNMASMEQTAKRKNWTGSVAVERFLRDMNFY